MHATGRLAVLEDSLKRIGPACFKGSDSDKYRANEKFKALLKEALKTEDVFNYPFDSLKFIARLQAPDNTFRIFNWNIPRDDGTHEYFGFIIVNQEKVIRKKNQNGGKFAVYELIDKSAEIRTPELAKLTPDKWYGALYYKIILNTHKKHKYYTLLGWDGNTNLSWKKIIDVLTFTADGKPVFGEDDIFHKGRRTSRRVIFEFKAELVMALRYDEKDKNIVFDRLAPEISGAEGMYQFYVQTFVYDGYHFKKGKWQFVENIDARNPKNKNDDKYINPEGIPGTIKTTPPRKTGKKKQNVRRGT
ncbi:MAG: hypothetical protein Fur0041_13920 [Bacteroidia bacterium]